VRPTHFDESLTEGNHFLGCGVELASVAEDMTNFIVWEVERTRPLCLGKGSFLETDVGSGSTAAL
jgi:hypothetical protein